MKTQLEQAREGTITTIMQQVADNEGFSPEAIRQKVALGEVVIPNNPNRPAQKPVGIGMGLR
nr:phosphomethylpyrimidine synthase ThiC [Spirochaetales bacterium]